ncbi:MAG: 1-phosphofructokinase family hexose kinase [Actinobacteria bacterium]|nr:1-phosphofructokinase family hexose kinase [Actinomycetota bacterium]
MIYTVTLNPTLDITYVLEEVSFGEPVKANDVLKNPGGKGINVSRVLRSMGMDSVATTIVGGYVGEEVLHLLQKEGLILQVVKIENETRTNVVVYGRKDEKELVIRAAGPPVKDTETERITSFIFNVAISPELLVLSGSLPPGVKKDIYSSLINEAKTRGVKVVLDSDGRPFKFGVEAGPYLIKPNRVELQYLAGREMRDDAAIREFCEGLLEKGLEIVVVSLGSEGAMMITREGAWKGTVPSVAENTVGAGDSMVAGLLIGIVQSKPLEEMFRMGLACGVSAVMNAGPGLCEPEIYKEVYPEIEVQKIS